MMKKIVHLHVLVLLSLLSQVTSILRVRNPQDAVGSNFKVLDLIGRVEEQGRKAELHHVTTEDGYILGLFRILPTSSSHNQSHSGPPILLQHILLSSADLFITPDPEQNLAYFLSDAGYDVWLGNVRGNTYSRRHQTLSSDDPQFWEFGLDEQALKDLPAMFDYVLDTTKKSKLSYLGFSLGSTLSTILLSNRTEYNDKIDLVIHFAHATIFKFRSPTLEVFSIVGEFLKGAASDGSFSVLRDNDIIYFLIKYFCLNNMFTNVLCTTMYEFIFGRSYEEVNLADDRYLTPILCAIGGTSGKVLMHYWQFLRTGEFQYWNYLDEKTNVQHYGQIEPPNYNISNIAAPHLIFHGTNDVFTLTENLKVFISELPSTTTVIYQPVKNFNHNDFAFVNNVKSLVFDKLLAILSEFSNR